MYSNWNERLELGTTWNVRRTPRDVPMLWPDSTWVFDENKNSHILPTGQWYAPSAVIHYARYCMVLHGISWYCMIFHCIAWYCMIMHCIALYCMALHGIAWYCIVLHGIAWYIIVLHCIAWYCVVLHSIAWYCMVLHGIAWYCMVRSCTILR